MNFASMDCIGEEGACRYLEVTSGGGWCHNKVTCTGIETDISVKKISSGEPADDLEDVLLRIVDLLKDINEELKELKDRVKKLEER